MNRITGNSNIIGNNNVVVNSVGSGRHSNEKLIRNEAQEFAFYNLEDNSYIAGGDRAFIDKLRNELYNFYSTESKMFFLDELFSQVEKYIAENRDELEKEEVSIPEKILFFIKQEIDQLPHILRSNDQKVGDNRTKVFISYSHRDKSYLEDLKRHFRPLENIVEFWDDSLIRPGDTWKESIEVEIESAKVILLLVSADFYNSDFIRTNEIPKFLQKAAQEGASIIPVILKPCNFELYNEINNYQAINDPKNPVSSLDENSKEVLWVELVRQIRNIASK